MYRLDLSPNLPCDYLPGRTARHLVVIDHHLLDPAGYDDLLFQGYRRSGNHFYRPWCQHCRRCVAVRLPVYHFRPDRAQRRARRRNADLEAIWRRAHALDDEHWRLYHAYLQARHGDGEMAKAGRAESESFLFSPMIETELLELRLNGQLLAVAVTDVQPRSLSALYTFYHPDHAQRSLGTLAIQLQVAEARRRGLRWLYLGYWIGPCRKMSYKERFLPLEVRRSEAHPRLERWRRLDDRSAVQAFDEALDAADAHFERQWPFESDLTTPT